MTKMLKYFVLPLVVSFSRNRQLKTSNFVKNVTFPDGRTDGIGHKRTLFFFNLNVYTYDPCNCFASQNLS